MKKKYFAFAGAFVLMSTMCFTACGSKENAATKQQEVLQDKDELNSGDVSTVDLEEKNIKDSDGDGIGDKDEKKKYKTNPLCVDSDADRLSDGEEILEYKTDPLKADTDGDGANDDWEIRKGFDANTKDELFHITDKEVGDHTSITVELSLKGEYVERYYCLTHVNDNLFISPLIPGYLGSGYDLWLEGECDNAVMTYYFDESFLEEENFNPVIYCYDEEEKEFNPVETQWDGESNFVTAKITKFSTYLLLDKTKYDEVWEREILPPS